MLDWLVDYCNKAPRPRSGDPYNSADELPATDVVPWDANTVEVVVLETPGEDPDATAELPMLEYP